MAHPSDGSLRRIYDDPGAKTGADALHLENCAACQARLEAISQDAGAVANLLAVPDLKVDVDRAFAQLTSAPAAQPRFAIRMPLHRSTSRSLVLGLAAAIAMLGLIVTAVAQGGFSSTPTTVKIVPVSVADMQALYQLSEYGTLAWKTQPRFQLVTSADQLPAGSLTPPAAGYVPSSVTSTTVTYATVSAAEATFTFSKEKAAAAAANSGKTLPPVPKGMDGAKITVTLGPAVAKIYGNLQAPPKGTDITEMSLPQLVVAKSAAPKVASPDISFVDFQTYMLNQPGMTPSLAAAIRALGNDGKTLPVLIPTQLMSKTEDYSVQGRYAAVVLGDDTGLGSGAVWINGGYVYAVGGTIKKSDAKKVADNLS